MRLVWKGGSHPRCTINYRLVVEMSVHLGSRLAGRVSCCVVGSGRIFSVDAGDDPTGGESRDETRGRALDIPFKDFPRCLIDSNDEL